MLFRLSQYWYSDTEREKPARDLVNKVPDGGVCWHYGGMQRRARVLSPTMLQPVVLLSIILQHPVDMEMKRARAKHMFQIDDKNIIIQSFVYDLKVCFG